MIEGRAYVTGNLSKSMTILTCNRGGIIRCSKISIPDFKALSEEYKIYGYFSNNDQGIVKKLADWGINYIPIREKIELDPDICDTLYVINAKNYNVLESNEIPDSVTVEILKYQVSIC